ncbi:AAA family ATPase [Clostridium aminobutyricum]|uniref:Cytidylate kinase-like family protein n=1 Tax=Clostridium aminobutyricum TaxID=33953 RepID=A0A939D9D6_CLOAM|nr:cytidylate kinase-like family protein [Clostridium aminobutyricum]MBN7773612.1 cytidylate kinase-like family protein [Clostridium aminobutyricum]
MIITIGREYGSGGHEIGKRLAEHYQIPFYDKEALFKVAREKGIYDEILSFYEEKPVNSLLYAIAMDSYSENIGKMQFDAMKSITENGPCVIIGRCGNYIFKDTPDTVSVFLHAELEKRIKRVKDVYGIDQKGLLNLIEKTDKQRASFHKFYTDQEWGDARNYHLAVNSGEIGIDSCVELIAEFIEKKKRNLWK